MGEILSSSVFGIAFLVISIVLLYKERYTGSMILRYLASYMYCSLAYTTYTVVLTEHAQFIFIGLALAMLGDVAMSLKLVVEKYEDIAHYSGMLLYIAEGIIFAYATIIKGNINIALGFVSVLITALIVFLNVRKKKKLNIVQLISNILLLLVSFFLAILGILALISAVNLTNILFAVGTVLIAIGSTFFVIDQYTINDYFFLKACNISCRYLGQLLITISMVFIFYV